MRGYRKAPMCRAALLALAATFHADAACASETGGTVYPQGPEGYTGAALPPPGTYFLGYIEHYTASRFVDGEGKPGFLPDFDVQATAEINRIVRVEPITFLGASVAHHLIVPVVNLDVNIAGQHDRRAGIGDITLTPLILGWHGKTTHVVVGMDINLPVGGYDRTRLANLGRNYWNFEPVLTLAYYAPKGFTLDAKFMYDFNLKNTNAVINGLNPTGASYRSGQEFHVDFALGQQVGPWKLGTSGYFYTQVTGDRVDDAAAQATLDALRGFKGRVFAIGPSVQRNAGKVLLIASWQHEMAVQYRPQGDKFWLKAIIPLGK